MTGNGSESPEQEDVRLREENARLRRILAHHNIQIPQLSPASPPHANAIETVSTVDTEERATKRIALFRNPRTSLSRRRRGERHRRDVRIYFDACCLNRLTDDHSQRRVAIEAEAVDQILRLSG